MSKILINYIKVNKDSGIKTDKRKGKQITKVKKGKRFLIKRVR